MLERNGSRGEEEGSDRRVLRNDDITVIYIPILSLVARSTFVSSPVMVVDGAQITLNNRGHPSSTIL